MARPRKDVKFSHRAGNGKVRRPSMSVSEMSENASEPGSPTRNGAVAKAEPAVSPNPPLRQALRIFTDYPSLRSHPPSPTMKRRSRTSLRAQYGP